MLDKRILEGTKIYDEMDIETRNYWFDVKLKKFLHNIDTFYFSVKFTNDFTANTEDKNVLSFRHYFERQYKFLADRPYGDCLPILFKGMDRNLNLRNFSFAGIYKICLECPEWFDILFAPTVPRAKDSNSSVTCECIVQIRSYMLWMYGFSSAFERAYDVVKILADVFHLGIESVQENRVDYCWHSNYLKNPEYFFNMENFYKMRVDRFKGAGYHTDKVGSEGFEIDYLSVGKRSDKIFIRIYLKSKEVIEQGYKPWFFNMWLFNGLINRYDYYVYDKAYRKGNWQYCDLARLEYYSEFGQDEEKKELCQALLSDEEVFHKPDVVKALADQLTPKLTLIMNVEYQVMRRHSKSYQLLPFKDVYKDPRAERVYSLMYNRRLVCDYLTSSVFRLVEPTGDKNKARRPMCGFWNALRRCKMVDVKLLPEQVKLTRQYCQNLSKDIMKERVIKSAVTLGIYTKGLNFDSPMQDVVDALCRLNDNDMQSAIRFKNKKISQFNEDELADLVEPDVKDYTVIDSQSGEILF